MWPIDKAREHLRRHYAIDGHLERVPAGRAANYAVSDRGVRWLFKVFQLEYTPARVRRGSDFVTFLADTGYPVRQFVPSNTGERVTVLDGRAAVLIPWIEGDAPEANTVASSDAIGQIGSLCGRLHRLALEYPAFEAAPTVSRATPERLVDQKRDALHELASRTNDVQINNEINQRLAILDTLGGALAVSRQSLRRGIIHGDFYCTHVVFREHLAAGVIDVLGEHYIPGWELMRGFFQSVPSPFESGGVDEALWQAYITAYASECPVDAHAITAAYDAYLLQLTASRYGLDSPLNNGLRRFGRWRTRLACYLAEHRQDIRSMMAGDVAR